MGVNNIKIAVLSGKGGTGKTLIAVNLAAASGQAVYIDCDVEEPNGHLFLKPHNLKSKRISVKIPAVDTNFCKGCRRCADFCKFNALAYIKNKLIIFDEVCHSCGGCILVCPEKALLEKEKVVGEIQSGISKNVTVITGILNIGEASGVPIIKELIKGIPKDEEYVFIDCPPGSACIVMESIKDVDYCILVAEPTLFGTHNLNMVYELVKVFDKPYGVVLNKCMDMENPAEKFCLENGIAILGRIPFDTELGIMSSDAKIPAREKTKYRDLFQSLLQKVTKEVLHETVTNP